jgi:hypothetical protein
VKSVTVQSLLVLNQINYFYSSKIYICKISDFHYGVDEVFPFLGCYTAYVGSCLPTLSRDGTRYGTDNLSLNVGKQLPTYAA